MATGCYCPSATECWTRRCMPERLMGLDWSFCFLWVVLSFYIRYTQGKGIVAVNMKEVRSPHPTPEFRSSWHLPPSSCWYRAQEAAALAPMIESPTRMWETLHVFCLKSLREWTSEDNDHSLFASSSPLFSLSLTLFLTGLFCFPEPPFLLSLSIDKFYEDLGE